MSGGAEPQLARQHLVRQRVEEPPPGALVGLERGEPHQGELLHGFGVRRLGTARLELARGGGGRGRRGGGGSRRRARLGGTGRRAHERGERDEALIHGAAASRSRGRRAPPRGLAPSALIPKTFSASSSLPIATSTYSMSRVIAAWASAGVHSFLR